MSKAIKRALSVLLCAFLLFGALPLTAVQAADPTSGTCGDNLTWNYDASTATLTISGTGAMNDYYSSSPWNAYRTAIQSVVINSGVTSIGNDAFSGCTGLTSLTIPDNVTRIGSSAFEDCSGLTSVTIPDRVTSIGNRAFLDCTGLTSVNIGTSVTSIGESAFYNCTSLTSVTIPDSVTSIGHDAFHKCTDLISVTIGNSVTSIDYSAFFNCIGLTSVTIPDSVTSIGSSAFYMVANVVYHGSASGSPWGARAANGYVEEPLVYADSTKTNLLACPSSYRGAVTIPASVTSIGESAFEGCTGLTSVTIPDSVTRIGNGAFYKCTGLTSVTIPDSVTSIGESAFEGCHGLTSVAIPNSVTNIGYGAFRGCTGLTEINYSAVNVADLLSDSNVFYNAGTKGGGITVTFGDSVQRIPAYLFFGYDSSYCPNIKTVSIGNSVTSIGDLAFANCTRLTNVTILDSVTSIGEYAFYNCTGLTDCYYRGTQEQWNAITINSGNDDLLNATIHFNSTPPHVHTYTETITKQPTCTEEGVRTYICECGDSYTETIPALEHSYGEWTVITAPTCTAAGEEQRVCADCGKTETREVEALGHDYVASVIAPTCVDEGFTAHVCSRCHDTYTTDVVPATGHTCSEWMMLVDPTLTADGVMGRKCTVCGAVLDEVTVPRLAGDHVTGVALSAARVYMNRGETLTLTAAVTPDTAHNKALAWSSSHPETATVTNGAVTAVAPGLAVIIAQAEDSGHKDFCVVQVNAVTPQNGAVIENGTITGLRANLNSMEDYLNLLDESMTVETNGTIGTGTKVYIMRGDTVVNEFETVLFGDVDGDGWYDGTDAYYVKLAASGMIPAAALTEAQRMAADCNHDGTVDNADVALLEQAGLLLANVEQTLPREELQTDSIYLEYCSLIDQTVEIIEPEQPAVDQPAQTVEQPAAPSVWGWIKALFTIVLNWLLRVF